MFIASMTRFLSFVVFAGALVLPVKAQQAEPRGTAGARATGGPVLRSAPEVRRTMAEAMPADEVAVLVVAGEETTLSAQMGGKILRVGVGLGDAVASGALLLEFDCSEQ